MVIALTHMMKYNDIKLAKQVSGIDLILGGHDHLITQEKVNDSVIIKSGTDFRNFSIIKIHRNTNQSQ
jgi:5'-nucleotidase